MSTRDSQCFFESCVLALQLRQRHVRDYFKEQLQLHLPQKHKATVQGSALRVEMLNLEEQADNAKAQLYWKPMA